MYTMYVTCMSAINYSKENSQDQKREGDENQGDSYQLISVHPLYVL